jgi:imidazolonepropionase-like amidohydrolase
MSAVSRASALLALLLLVHAGAAVSQDLVIEHVTLVSPERAAPRADVSVSIRAGRISAIGRTTPVRAGTPRLDGRGLYLSPGLIDSHVHLGMIPGMTAEQEEHHPDIARAAREQFPRSYLYHGFTTLIDLISDPAVMARWRAARLLPDTYFCGGVPVVDGYPTNYVPKPQRYQMPYMVLEPGTGVPPGIAAADHTPQAVVARMKADGAICVKTFFERGFGGVHDLPVPSLQTLRALVAAAHAAGLPVLMHANAAEAQRVGLDAGVDILAHGLWNWEEDAAPGALTPQVQSILDRVVASNTGWQPTLSVLHGLSALFEPGWLSDPRLAAVLPRSLIDWYGSAEGQWFHDAIAADVKEPDAARAAARLRAGFAVPIGHGALATGYLARHHARLLFGTDTPSAPTFANPPGLNGALEMQRLLEAGVSPAQIFAAATLVNARALGLDREVGSIEVGKRANLLLTRADPRADIGAYRGIVTVVLGGRMLSREALRADGARPGP